MRASFLCWYTFSNKIEYGRFEGLLNSTCGVYEAMRGRSHLLWSSVLKASNRIRLEHIDMRSTRTACTIMRSMSVLVVWVSQLSCIRFTALEIQAGLPVSAPLGWIRTERRFNQIGCQPFLCHHILIQKWSLKDSMYPPLATMLWHSFTLPRGFRSCFPLVCSLGFAGNTQDSCLSGHLLALCYSWAQFLFIGYQLPRFQCMCLSSGFGLLHFCFCPFALKRKSCTSEI